MKRAVFLCIATATLLLFGLPSAPLQAESKFSSKTTVGLSVIAPGTGQVSGAPVAPGNGGGGGGGTEEGDADGLSGLKNPPPISGVAVPQTERASVFLEVWWRFMILLAR
jgi:hypothetical protein